MLRRACPSGAPSSGSCAVRRAPFLSKPGALCDPIRRLVSLCWRRPLSDLRSSPHVPQKWMWPLEQSWLQNLAVMDGLGSGLLRGGGGGLLAGPGGSWTQPLVPGKQAPGATSGRPPGASVPRWELPLLQMRSTGSGQPLCHLAV